MKHAKKFTVFSILILLSLISSLVFPISVLADDTTPPPADTPEVSQPTEAPVATEAPVSVEATPAAPVVTDVPVLEVATLTEEPVMEASSTTPATTEVPATQAADSVNLSEIVQAAADNNLMLAEPSGDPLGLGTVQAAETLTTGDPYFTSGGVLYSFTFADCNPVLNGAQPCSSPMYICQLLLVSCPEKE